MCMKKLNLCCSNMKTHFRMDSLKKEIIPVRYCGFAWNNWNFVVQNMKTNFRMGQLEEGNIDVYIYNWKRFNVICYYFIINEYLNTLHFFFESHTVFTLSRRSGSFRPRVVSALGCFGLGRFCLGRFGPGSFRPILVGRFGLIFLSPPRLRRIGRTIIWLFDEESSDVKELFF